MSSNREDTFSAKGGWLVVVQVTLMALVLASGPMTGRTTNSPVQLAVALALIAVGACHGIAGIRALGRNRTVFPKPRSDGQLITGGVFQLVRHPLYASLIHLGFGWALLWQNWNTALISLVMTAQLYQKSQSEEAWLLQKFPAYEAYAKRVKRFIPWIW